MEGPSLVIVELAKKEPLPLFPAAGASLATLRASCPCAGWDAPGISPGQPKSVNDSSHHSCKGASLSPTGL